MKAYVSCVGCEQRELDAQRVINYLKKNKVTITKNPKDADYLFVITCGVDATNERNSVEAIRDAYEKRHLNSKLIVGGCLPSISPEKFQQYNVFYFFSPRTIDTLDEVMDLNEPISGVEAPNVSIYDIHQELKAKQSARERFEMAKNGYKIVIAQGCKSDCSYCQIKKATGRLQSEPLEKIIRKVEQGAQRNEPTIMLMAGDTGAYGQDIDLNFATLLKKITSLDGNFKVYIHDFGVNWLIKDLPEYLEVFQKADKNRIIGGMTIPIQSGSNNILKLMNRKYRRENVIEVINSISNYSFDIGTHIMVGFPGEADADFDETLDLLKKVNFDFVTCFPYSEHPLASSATLDEKVASEVVEKRILQISKSLGKKVKVIQ